jgi:hypothetical protein
MLGGNAKYVIYYYIQKNFRLKKEEIPEHPEVFIQAITFFLGEEGSKIIEKLIVQKMMQTFKLKNKSKLTFVKAVQAVKGR